MWIRRGLSVLIVGMGLGASACQSNGVSQTLVSSDSPTTTEEEAIADSEIPGGNETELLQPSLSNGDSVRTDIGPVTVADTALSTDVNKDGSTENSAALDLANHLTAMGAQMFGAYWCPHCQEQKKMFGEAFSAVDYVECDPGGENPRTQDCLDNDIEAFPTWVINDEQHLGVHSLPELAELSGYEGEV